MRKRFPKWLVGKAGNGVQEKSGNVFSLRHKDLWTLAADLCCFSYEYKSPVYAKRSKSQSCCGGGSDRIGNYRFFRRLCRELRKN